MRVYALEVIVAVSFVCLTPGTLCGDAYPDENVMYTPKGIHFISLQAFDEVTGKKTLKNYTVSDESLAFLNATVEQLERGRLRETESGRLVLELPSGRNLTIAVEQRTVVKLVDKSGKSDFGVDLQGFEGLSMDDLKNDTSLVPEPSPSLQWPEPDWRPLRSVTVLVNSSSVTVLINRHNLVFNMTTNVTHPGLVWHRPHGIVMLVVHPMTCRVTFANVFPTAEFGGYRDLMDSLERVAPGRVVVIAALHDGSLQLLEAREYLKYKLGSFASDQYLFRDSWAWVFIKSGQSLGEAFSPNLPRDWPGLNTSNVNFEELLRKENESYANDVDALKQSLSHALDVLPEKITNSNEIVTKIEPGEYNQILPNISGDRFTKKPISSPGNASSATSNSAANSTELSEPRQFPSSSNTDYDQGDFEYDTLVWNSEFFKSMNKTIRKAAGPLLLDARIPVHEDPIYLLTEYDECKVWREAASINDRWAARIRFCQMYDGYASLCDCKDPFFLKKNRGSLTSPYDHDIPILILTANRTRLLFRVLEALGSQPGVHQELITVVMDGTHEEAVRLAHVLDFRLLIHRPEGNGSVLVSRNLRFALYHMLHLYPDAQQFIVLEDDLILSPDFYKYMQHTAPIFALDKTVYCVSAFNHLSYPHTAHDPTQLYRVESFPAYGWMLPRSEVTDVLPRWFPANVTHDWDFMLGMTLLNRRRECVIPDVNRALHGGTVGLHARASWFHERHYSRRTINTNATVELVPIEKLRSQDYEAEMHALIAKASPVAEFDLYNFSLNTTKNGMHVIFVDQPVANTVKIDGKYVEGKHINEPVYKTIGEALHVWNTDVRELHKNTWRLYYRGQLLFVVGCPMSPYCKYMPANYLLLAVGETSEIEKIIEEEYSLAHVRKIPFIYHQLPEDNIWRKMMDTPRVL